MRDGDNSEFTRDIERLATVQSICCMTSAHERLSCRYPYSGRDAGESHRWNGISTERLRTTKRTGGRQGVHRVHRRWRWRQYRRIYSVRDRRREIRWKRKSCRIGDSRGLWGGCSDSGCRRFLWCPFTVHCGLLFRRCCGRIVVRTVVHSVQQFLTGVASCKRVQLGFDDLVSVRLDIRTGFVDPLVEVSRPALRQHNIFKQRKGRMRAACHVGFMRGRVLSEASIGSAGMRHYSNGKTGESG